MTASELAAKILDSMLGHLGIASEIEAQETSDGTCLQIFSSEKETIIGNNGDRLDDIQYLVNRILRRQMPDAGRVRVDCEHFRSMQEDQLQEEVRELVELVKSQGKTYKMRPLNAYYRRLAYNVIAGEEGISATSPSGDDRLKRISISPK
ncbi:MAG: single-stranded DNA-binding protein [Akkermansiaceae bacterium]|jgi:spoIIIJ-associated protein|nr:single-stranded DNA-binding protein [Akkermansiaceae bacterium]